MNYNKKTVTDIDVAGKKVLLRCDFNVPMSKSNDGTILDDKRIREALPTIRYLMEQNAAVIALLSYGQAQGQVEGRIDPGSRGKASERAVGAKCAPDR